MSICENGRNKNETGCEAPGHSKALKSSFIPDDFNNSTVSISLTSYIPMHRHSRFLFLLCSLLLPASALGQDGPKRSEVGMPFFYEHFRSQNYRHYPQNWSIVQDQRGVIYVANRDGVLEYDGTRWQLIETAKKAVVRSLAVGTDGTVYVGTSGDFGYLAPDSIGTLRYVSLPEKINQEVGGFSDVWSTHATSDGVYFQTKDRLFFWDGNEIKIWESKTGFHTSFVVYDQFYIREKGIGLSQVVDGVLQPTPGGEHFAEIRVFVMLPYAEDDILIGTGNKGFFVYDEGVVTPLPTQMDSMMQDKDFLLYHGCVLPGGLYALASLGSGGFIIDQQGQLIQRLNKDAGFPDEWINYVYSDAQGGLWMALDAAGLVRVDAPSKVTVYNDQLDLHGTIYAIQRHQDTLFVGTSTGLVKLQQFASDEEEFSPSIRGVLSGDPTPDLLSADSILFAATHNGLFRLRDGAADTLLTGNRIFSLFESKRYPGQILVGKKDGLARLRYTSEGWESQSLYTGKAPTGDIRSIAEDEDGIIWLEAADGTVLRGRFPRGEGVWEAERFGVQDGLPDDLIGISPVDGTVVFLSTRGVYQFNPEGKDGAKFYQDDTFFADSDSSLAPLRSFVQDQDGNRWAVYEDRIDIAILQEDGSYRHETPPVLHFLKSTVESLYIEDDGIAWIGNGDQLVRYDPSVQKDYTAGFSALLRRIVATRTERVLYGGAPVTPSSTLPTIIDHTDNDLRFEVSAPSYNDVSTTRYQYYMEGYDKTWSDWAPAPNRTYNELQGGKYTLRVRARNAQGVLSTEAIFSFRVLPPWYRTWWAYTLYLVILLAAAAFSKRHYRIVQENKQAQEQARELERERDLNQRLQEANESLVQANHLKDAFLANTSHELRTPLTAILGFAHILKDELPELYHELIDPIELNGQRLLHTLNALLEVARLRAGMLEIYPRKVNVGEQAAEALRLLAPLAKQKELALDLVSPPEPLFASLDQHCFEQILNNLVGNAIKFTNAGSVTVTVEQQGDRVYVHVRDTGIGIDVNFIPHLFDEFKQESTGLTRSHEGNGLGLAITTRLVELMDGDVAVQSEKGKGSVFSISFPFYIPEQAEPSADRRAQRSPEQPPARTQGLVASSGR